MLPNPDDSIEKYAIYEELGRGGFATVKRAVRKEDGLEVAIKMIDKKIMKARRMAVRVRDEVEIHAQLEHESIIKLFSCFEDKNYVYLVLELCHNGELQNYLTRRQAPLSEDEVRSFLLQIVHGLQYLHSHSIMHRDLSLKNLLLTKDYRIKIADFGLSTQLTEPEEKHMTMCGTPNFISPEIASRKPHGLESDTWSLGCMLFTLLTGKPPFDTNAIYKTINRVVQVDYNMPDSISPEAQDLIRQLLKKIPEERPKLDVVLKHPFLSRRSPSCLTLPGGQSTLTSTMTTGAFNHSQQASSMTSMTAGSAQQLKQSISPRDSPHPLSLPLSNATPLCSSSSSSTSSASSGSFKPIASFNESIDSGRGTIASTSQRGANATMGSGGGGGYSTMLSNSTVNQTLANTTANTTANTRYMVDSSYGSTMQLAPDEEFRYKQQPPAVHHSHHHHQLAQQQQQQSYGSSTNSSFHQTQKMAAQAANSSTSYPSSMISSSNSSSLSSSSKQPLQYRSTTPGLVDPTTHAHYAANTGAGATVGGATLSSSNELTSSSSSFHSSAHAHAPQPPPSDSSQQQQQLYYNRFIKSSQQQQPQQPLGKQAAYSPSKVMYPGGLDQQRSNSVTAHLATYQPPNEDYQNYPAGQHFAQYENPKFKLASSSAAAISTDNLHSVHRVHQAADLRYRSPSPSASGPSAHKSMPPQQQQSHEFSRSQPQTAPAPQSSVVKSTPAKTVSSVKNKNKNRQKPNSYIQNAESLSELTARVQLGSVLLRNTRQVVTRSAIVHIRNQNQLVMEIVKKSKSNPDKSETEDVMCIDLERDRVVYYKPTCDELGRRVATHESRPPPEPTPRTKENYCEFTYDTLPKHLWPMYVLAARFVTMMRTSTPKVTMYTEEGKYVLYDTSPDFSMEFTANGHKIHCTGAQSQEIKITNSDGSVVFAGVGEQLPVEYMQMVALARLHHTEGLEHEKHLRRMETRALEMRGKLTRSFPAVIGQKPESKAKNGCTQGKDESCSRVRDQSTTSNFRVGENTFEDEDLTEQVSYNSSARTGRPASSTAGILSRQTSGSGLQNGLRTIKSSISTTDISAGQQQQMLNQQSDVASLSNQFNGLNTNFRPVSASAAGYHSQQQQQQVVFKKQQSFEPSNQYQQQFGGSHHHQFGGGSTPVPTPTPAPTPTPVQSHLMSRQLTSPSPSPSPLSSSTASYQYNVSSNEERSSQQTPQQHSHFNYVHYESAQSYIDQQQQQQQQLPAHGYSNYNLSHQQMHPSYTHMHAAAHLQQQQHHQY